MEPLNFWDLNYISYILGFLLFPRATIILIFYNYITKGFEWSLVFLGFTIWWKFPMLALGGWSKLFFMILFGFFPRTLLAIIGYYSLSAQNHIPMLVLLCFGVIIDIFMKLVKRFVAN